MTAAARRITALVFLVLLGGAVYSYWSGLGPLRHKQAQGSANAVPILAAAARLADVPVYLGGIGTVKASNTVTVLPQVDGKLINVFFSEGQEVPKGFVLAKIDPSTYQAQYDEAVAKKSQDEATLANARLDLERYVKLAATNAVQRQQLDSQKALVDQLTAQVQSDQAVIDNAKAVLAYTDVVAPIAGLTGIRQVDQGNIVHATDTTGLVVLTQIKPVAVQFSLPQQVLSALTKAYVAGELPVQVMDQDGTTVIDSGKVVVIDNQVDPMTGAVQVKAEFPNLEQRLWPGQFVNVRLLIDTLHQVVVVPPEAVQEGTDGDLVYVVRNDDTIEVRPIKVRQRAQGQAVVASGLAAQERVATSGFARLSDGGRVDVAGADTVGQASGAPRRNTGDPSGGGQRPQRAGADAGR
jgi:multidrug efflux system membrane fusion protein